MAHENLSNELSKLRIDKSQKHPPRRSYRWLWLPILLLAGVGYLYYAKANAAIPVKVARPELDKSSGEGIAILTAGGYIIPRHKIEVSSKIIGRVQDMLVDRGDQVHQGDVLLRIEDEEYAAQVRVAEAQMGNIKAKLKELQSGSREQEKAAARAAVASAAATLDGAKLERNRLESLIKDDYISRQELDRIRTSFQVAQANLESARKNAELVEIGPRQEQIEAAQAQLRQAEANLAYTRTQLGFTVLRAPITGTILEKLAEKGELVTNTNFGGTRGAKSSVVSMANLNDLQVEIDLNENDLPKVHLRQPCEIRLDSDPDKVFKGEVDEIAPSADRQKATVQVKVRILNPAGQIRPEVNARVTFITNPAKSDHLAPNQTRIWIPRTALVNGSNGTMVYVASAGTAVARPIKIGDVGEKGIQVTDGLTGTEQLIIEPLDKIKDGARIQVAS